MGIIDRPQPRPTRHDEGFTIIELLVAVIIIGILAGIAIPIYLHQKASAHDAQAVEAVRAVAQTVETHADELEGQLDRGPGDATIVDAAGHQYGVTLSSGVGWGIVGSTDGYCVVATAAQGKRTVTFDSLTGGVGRSGGACRSDGLPVASIGEVGRTGGSGTSVPASGNLIGDSGFTQLPAARVDAVTPTTGSAANVASWQGGTWRATSTRTPIGYRAIEVITTAASTQGVIVYPATATPISGPALAQNDTITGSPFVLAPRDQKMVLALRVVTANRTWVGEFTQGFTGTGSWQRVHIKYIPGYLDTGMFASLAVGTKIPAPAGVRFSICGPQIETGLSVSPYAATS